jgi:hypothetical protein
MSLAAHRDVFWLDVRAGEATVGALSVRLAALEQLAGDLDERLKAGGVAGLAGAARIYEQIRTVLDEVSADDLRRMADEVVRMQAELADIDRRLAAMREMKRLLDRLETPSS